MFGKGRCGLVLLALVSSLSDKDGEATVRTQEQQVGQGDGDLHWSLVGAPRAHVPPRDRMETPVGRAAGSE